MGGGGASIGLMLLMLDAALVMVMGGWVSEALIGTHNPWASWERFESL